MAESTARPAARRPGAIRQDLALAALVAAAAAFALAPALFDPRRYLSHPRSDIYSQYLPLRQVFVRAVHERHELPLWNPTMFGGMPFVGDPESGLFYPPNWLHLLLPAEETARIFAPLVALHLAIGGLGMLCWLRGHGFGGAARLLGALAFAFSGKWFFHVVYAGHVVFLPLVWLPWQCWLVDRTWQRPTLRRASALAAVGALTAVGSHPQLLLYQSLLLAAYAVAAGFQQRLRRPGRSVLALGGAACLALLLGAAHLLPVLAHLPATVRGQGVPYAFVAEGALAPRDALGFVVDLAPSKRLPWERSCYVGVAAGVLALFGWAHPCRRRTSLFFLGAIAFALVYAAGPSGGLHWLLHRFAPGFSALRIPTRMLLLLGLPVGYLAAAGFEAVWREPATAARAALAAACAAGAVALVVIHPRSEAVWAAVLIVAPLVGLAPLPAVTRRGLGLAIVGLVLLDLLTYGRSRVATLPLAELTAANPLVEPLLAPPGSQRVFALDLARPRQRGLPGLSPARITPYGVEEVRGYNSLIPRGVARYLWRGVAGRSEDLPTGPSITGIEGVASRPHLDLLNVRWLVTNRPIGLEGTELRHIVAAPAGEDIGGAAGSMTLFYWNRQAMPRAAIVRRTRRVASADAAMDAIGSFDPRREALVEVPEAVGDFAGDFEPVEVLHLGDAIHLSADAGPGGFLLLSEMWHPGWQARDNGREVPIHRANGLFQLLRLEAGRHEIVLRFRPGSYVLGLSLSLAAALGCGVLCLWRGRRQG